MRSMKMWARAVVIALSVILWSAGAAAASNDPALDNANALYDKGDFKGAVAAANAILAKDPQNAKALVLRGDAEDNLNNTDAALADYNAAIAINPNYEYAYATRCATQNELDHYRDAIADCTKALTLVRDDDYAFRSRSFAYFMLDDYELASADAEQAISIDGTNPWNILARCRTDVWMNRLKSGLPACNTFVANKPANASGYFYRGRGEMLGGDAASARADFNKTLQIDSTYVSADYWLALLELDAKNYNQSLTAANAFLEKYPDEADILLAKAGAEFGLGKKDSAKYDASQALRRYQIQNDSDGMKKAQAVLDAMQ